MTVEIEQRMSTVENQQLQFKEELRQLTKTVHTIDDRTRESEKTNVKTQTLLEVVQQDVRNTNMNVQKLTESQQEMFKAITEERIQRAQADSQQEVKQISAWQKFSESRYSTVIGYILTIFSTLMIGKYIHF